MKNFIYISSALALVACSNDDVVQSSASDDIKFEVVTNTASRAAEVHSSANQPDKFTVSAYTRHLNAADKTAEGVLYIGDQEVTKGTSGWAFTSGKKYLWPTYDALDFYALHDNTSGYTLSWSKIAAVDDADNTFNGKSAVKVTGFQMQPASDQDDVLYAVAQNQTNTEENGGKVSLNFRHALSAINFKIENATYHYYIEVQNISLCNLAKSADLYLGANTDTQYTNTDGTTEYSYTKNCYWKLDNTTTKDVALYADRTDETYDYVPPKYSSSSSTTQVYTYAYSADAQTLMVFPQPYVKATVNTDDATATTTWSNIYVKLRCRIYYIESTLDFLKKIETIENSTAASIHELIKGNKTGSGYTYAGYGSLQFGVDGTLNDDGSFTDDGFKDMYIPLPQIMDADSNNLGWQPGKRYVYTLSFGNDGNNAFDASGDPSLVPIKVSPTVEDWTVDNSISGLIVQPG